MGDTLFNLLSCLPVVLDVLVSGLYNLFYLVTNPAAEEARVFVPIEFNSACSICTGNAGCDHNYSKIS
jgi:hypothetical protein